MSSKDYLISEIQRTTLQNGGTPLGMGNFEKLTGIKKNDWFGKYWAKWSDALAEAGYAPNRFGLPAYDKEWLLEQLAKFVRELGHFPTKGEFKLKHSGDPEFPSLTTLNNKLGYKNGMIRNVVDFCKGRKEFQDVLEICSPILSTAIIETAKLSNDDNIAYGFVYLIKSGKYYKIGRSNDAGRRSYELNIQLPERAEFVHAIRTDDPVGIEAYWHKRFAGNRKNGERFELDQDDVRAFKRRSFM